MKDALSNLINSRKAMISHLEGVVKSLMELKTAMAAERELATREGDLLNTIQTLREELGLA